MRSSGNNYNFVSLFFFFAKSSRNAGGSGVSDRIIQHSNGISTRRSTVNKKTEFSMFG